MRKNESDNIITLFILFAVLVIVVAVASYFKMPGINIVEQALNLLLLLALVCVTGFYAIRTAEIANATRKQADASLKMAEEAREQRIMSSRPVVIQRVISSDILTPDIRPDNFEIYNSGNGPAIELEIILLDKDKKILQSQRNTFLRAGEPPLTFYPHDLVSHVNSSCYLLCQYQDILSHDAKRRWYQTWLPFEVVKSSEAGKILLNPGELEFKEVSESDRVDALSSRSKPK